MRSWLSSAGEAGLWLSRGPPGSSWKALEVTWAHPLLRGRHPEGTGPCSSSTVVQSGPETRPSEYRPVRDPLQNSGCPRSVQWTQGPRGKVPPSSPFPGVLLPLPPEVPKARCFLPLQKGSSPGAPTDPFPKFLQGTANRLGGEVGCVFPDFCSGHTGKVQWSHLMGGEGEDFVHPLCSEGFQRRPSEASGC